MNSDARFSFDPDGPIEYRLVGFSPCDPETTFNNVLATEDGLDIGGDFVLIASGVRGGESLDIVITSPFCAVPYYYGERRDTHRVAHGQTVHGVAAKLQMPWRWNRAALVNLLVFEHTLCRETLHEGVHHIPAGCVMAFASKNRQERFYFDREKLFAWKQVRTIDEAVSCFSEVADQTLVQKPVVSLSSGFDSRVILAHMLGKGITPRVITMGHEHSSDVMVARQIAARFGLEHQVVPLDIEGYLSHRKRIVTLTGGAKTAKHWHTYLYAASADLAPNDIHYIGSNGSFAKTNGFDLGELTLLAERLGIPVFTPVIGINNLEHVVGNLLLEAFADGSVFAVLRRALNQARRACTAEQSSVGRLNEFGAFERLRHFNGQGHALLGDFSPVRTPFVDVRFARLAQQLNRRERLGCNFHRAAISKFCPALLAFQIKGETSVARRAPIGYALRGGDRVGYTQLERVTAQDGMRDLVMSNGSLDALVDSKTRARVFDSNHVEAKLVLFTLSTLCEVTKEKGTTCTDRPVLGAPSQPSPDGRLDAGGGQNTAISAFRSPRYSDTISCSLPPSSECPTGEGPGMGALQSAAHNRTDRKEMEI